jgi:manganese/iron transport system permease protein
VSDVEALLALLTEPWQFEFMRRAAATAAVVGVVCGAVGTYLVLRGMALVGDALGHAVFPGIVAASIFRVDPLIGAVSAGVLTAVGITTLQRRGGLRADVAMGILYAGAFAAGVALLSTQRSFAVDLTSFLTGYVLAVSPRDLLVIALIAALVLATLALFHRGLVAATFDPSGAAVLGLPVNRLELTLMVCVALAVVASVQTVGTVMVVAMLVTASATARMLTRRILPMMITSGAIGAFSGVAGLFAAYHLGISAGAAIVLVCTTMFLAVLLVRKATAGLHRAVASA